MNTSNIDGVLIIPQKIIDVIGGDVLHGMKSSDPGYMGFGEAYFSMVDPGVVKAWKRHREMTLNLIIPFGAVRLVFYDDRGNSMSKGRYKEIIISRDNYCRVKVPPMVWFGFQGVYQNTSVLLNIADVEHSPGEVDKKDINDIKYSWELTE